MGNRHSAGKADDADSAYAAFEKLFSEFLSSRLLHHPESRQFLTLSEVLQKFSREHPDHQHFVSNDDESSNGWLIHYALRLTEKQFGCCVMVVANRSCLSCSHPTLRQSLWHDYGKMMTSYYKDAVLLGFSWNHDISLIDL